MPSAQSQPRGKYWCFTLNNYTDEDLLAISKWYDDGLVDFAIVGKELGQNETPHLQGYVQVPQRVRLRQLKRLLPGLDRAHLESAQGSPEANIAYCSKSDAHPMQLGSPKLRTQGARSDLEALHQSLKQGCSLRSLCDNHFGAYLRYQRGIHAARSIYSTPRNWVTSVIVYYGRTGLGKTRAVYDNLPSPDALYTHVGGQWFDGYDGQSIVLFDDFSGSCFQLSYLLKLLDRYPMQVPVKGAFVNWAPREIYITSNLAPIQWYTRAHVEHVDALMRRFTNVVKFE